MGINLSMLALAIFCLLIWSLWKREKKTFESVISESASESTPQELDLSKITRQAIDSHDLDSFIAKIIPEVATILQVEYVQILELMPNQCACFFKAGYGWKKGLAGKATITAASDNFAGYTLQASEPIIIEDLLVETRFRGGPLLDNHQIVSGVMLKIAISGAKLGIFAVYTPKRRQFTSAEVNFLLSVSHLLAFVWHNQQQKESLSLFQRAIEASSNGITISSALEPDNRVVYVNESFVRITGYSKEEIIGQNCRFLQAQDSHQPEIQQIHQALEQGLECRVTLRNYRKDGSLFWNELKLLPIYNSQNHLTHFLGIQNDITLQKQAVDRIQTSEARFRSIFEQAAVGIAQVSLDGYFLQVNQKACELWGYTAQELTNVKFHDITHPDDLPESKQLFEQKLPSFVQEKRYLHKDGKIVWCQVTVTRCQDPTTETFYFIVVLIDITQRKQLEAELKNFNQSLKKLHQVATQVYHDQEALLINYLNAGCEILQLDIALITHIQNDQAQIYLTNSDLSTLNQGSKFSLKDSFCEQVISQEQTITCNHISQTELSKYPSHQQWGIKAYIGTPVWLNKQLFGTLVFYSSRPKQIPFTPQELQMVELMAESIGRLIHNQQIETAKLSNEKRFNSILSSLSDGVWSIDLVDRQLLYINETMEKIYGYPLRELVQNRQLWLQIIYPADLNEVKKVTANFLKEGTQKDIEYRIIKADGEIAWIRDRAQIIYDALGKKRRIDGIVTDITKRKLMEKQLRQEKDLLKGITQTSVAAIIVLNLHGKIIFANEKAEEILAVPRAQMLRMYYNSPIWKIKDFDGNPIPPEKLPFAQVMRTQQPVYKILHTIEWPDYTTRFLAVNAAPLTNGTGETRGVVLSIDDITEQQVLEQRLMHNAFYDSLTKLPNRTIFAELLHDAIEKQQQDSQHLFAVLFLDLDRFKLINDTFGHHVGDQLLISFAHRIKKFLRSHDTFARLSGDEFAILLPNIEEEGVAVQVAKRIQDKLRMPFYLENHEIFTSVSIGITYSNIGYTQVSDLLRDADLTMYKVKENGRAGYQIFVQTMHSELSNRLRLESELRKALSQKQLHLYYQPILSLSNQTIVGFEALIRWIHPEYGMISPAKFIPIAEETGMIVEIGLWVLFQACEQLQTWRENYSQAANLTISVNVSPRQLREPHIVQQVEQILSDSQLPPHLLKLEITENLLMENADTSYSVLAKLREQEIGLCLDDFGTGYSSLSYLHDFPFTILKVDQSFVRRIGVQAHKTEIIRGIIALAHSLKIAVVAEGIETWKQFSFLKYTGCEYGQGYFFSQPLNVLAATEKIQNSPRDV